jgi:cyclic-di-AMP phosphodiesterase PgpH
MFGSRKSSARRAAIRECRPDSYAVWWREFRASGRLGSVGIAAVFCVLAIAILMLREQVLPYRVGQTVAYDIISRADFSFKDKGLQEEKQVEAREHTPRVYRSNVDKITGDSWQPLQDELTSLPDKVAGLTLDQLPPQLRDVLDGGALTALQQYQTKAQRQRYNDSVNTFLQSLRDSKWVILNFDDRHQELTGQRAVSLLPVNQLMQSDSTYPAPANDELKSKINKFVIENFRLELQPKILALTLDALQPTYTLDADATTWARNNAADSLPASEWEIHFQKNAPIVHKGLIELRDWQLLRAENEAFLATLGGAEWKSKAGVAFVTLLLTIALAGYTAHFQPRVVRNHARAVSIAALLLSMLLLAQLAAIGSGPIYLLGVAPTLLVGMILSIAYDQRFAVGVTSIHGLMVTIGLDQRVGFLLVIWIGAITACFLLSDIRSRSKLIEVGGMSAIAMMLATAAWGEIMLDPWGYILTNCLYAGAAGLAVGFVVLGILPFVEKAFRITTTMTLLEMADASHPLLRRLAVEAPGTYSHSFQVATLAEAAAEAIHANALLCRVASYYHDIGKINKADYFVENQPPGQENRHLNLSPNVSFLIIKGHVSDGAELAREYNLPKSLMPFIQQHHGTTLVEFFYHAACTQQEQQGDQPAIDDAQFRYPGPRPRTKEVGIVMLADCVESAARAMIRATPDPATGKIEALVHELTLKRLLDGQLSDCDLTMRDLDRIEKSLAKTLLSIYHGRIAYPSNSSSQAPAAPAETSIDAKTA